MGFLTIPNITQAIKSRTSSIGSRNSGNSTPTTPTTPVTPTRSAGSGSRSKRPTIDYGTMESGVVHMFMNAPYVSPVPTVAGIPVETFDDKQRRVWGKVIDDVKEDYHQYPKDGTTWKPTTAQLSGYDISQHKTEEQARAAHLKNNPGEDSWYVTISVLPPGYIRPKDRASQLGGSLSQVQQFLVKQASHTSTSANHPERSQSEAETKEEALEAQWGSDLVLAGGAHNKAPQDPEAGWETQSAIDKPSRVLSFKSDVDGWRD